MFERFLIIFSFLIILGFEVSSQNQETISIHFIKKQNNTLPDQIINIPFFTKNNAPDITSISTNLSIPNGWSIITKVKPSVLKPLEQKFSVYSLQVPSGRASAFKT